MCCLRQQDSGVAISTHSISKKTHCSNSFDRNVSRTSRSVSRPLTTQHDTASVAQIQSSRALSRPLAAHPTPCLLRVRQCTTQTPEPPGHSRHNCGYHQQTAPLELNTQEVRSKHSHHEKHGWHVPFKAVSPQQYAIAARAQGKYNNGAAVGCRSSTAPAMARSKTNAIGMYFARQPPGLSNAQRCRNHFQTRMRQRAPDCNNAHCNDSDEGHHTTQPCINDL